MATVQKGAKINFYKFVSPAAATSTKVSGESQAVVQSINANVEATNNLGKTLNSLAKVVADIKKVQLAQLTLAEKNRIKFQPKYNKPQSSIGSSFITAMKAGKTPSFLSGLLNMLGALLKIAIITPALEWLSKKENQKKVKTIVETLVTIAKFIYDVAKFGVVNTIEGLYKILSDETNWWEKLGGLLQAAAGLGTLLLGIRWLSNPMNLVNDFGNVLKFLRANLIASKTRLGKRFGKRGLASVLVTGATIAIASSGNRVGDDDPPPKEEKNNNPPPKEEKSSTPLSDFFGGLRNMFSFGRKPEEKAAGGWISGPQSGYRVSLDGGKSTSFIGHGTEYVARKANGGAFVVPFDTPATRRMPHLTSKRMGEAKSGGFGLPGFAAGGTLPAGKVLSQKGAFDHVYQLAKKAGGAKFPQIVAAQAMHETGYLNPNIPSVYNSTTRTNAFGQTGDRGFGTIPRNGFSEGWTKYDNLFSAVKDNIKLWHDVGNHPENYNAFGNPLDGIAAVAKAYSPNADPANIKLGYTTDGYSKGMVRALKVGGFDPTNMKSSPLTSSNNSSGTRPQPKGNFFTNNFNRLKNFLGFGDDSQEKPDKNSNSSSKSIKPASHPETGSGFTISGTKDQNNRPLVFSEPAAEQFAAAMKASGMDLASFVASSGRSQEKNDAIGGHPESHHLYGEAVDINGKGYEWLKANGRQYGWQYVYNHNPNSAHFKYVGPKAGSTPILAAPNSKYAGGNSLNGHVGEGSREGSRAEEEAKKKERSAFAKAFAGNFTPSSSRSIEERMGMGQPGTMYQGGASNFRKTKEERALMEQTKKRNAARADINDRSQSMIQSVMAAVETSNSGNRMAIAQAQQAVMQMMAASQASGQTVSAGGGGGAVAKTTAAMLGSSMNAFSKIFR